MELPKDKKIVLFDGVCNLCNGTVNFLIKRDKKDLFRFASLQSETGQALLRERNIDPLSEDSIVLVEPGIAYYLRSDAALEIAESLGFPWKMLGVFKIVLPRTIRDHIYDLIAKNRYRWFGKQDQCALPSPSLKVKFLED